MFTGSLAPASNRADFKRLFELYDDDADEAIDLTDATIVFNITKPGCTSPEIVATTDDGKITLVDTGVFQVLVGRDEMTGLCAGQYDLGATIENADETESFIIGTIDVLDGKVSI